MVSNVCTLDAWQKQIKPIHRLLFNCSEFVHSNDEWVPFPIGLSVHVLNYRNYEQSQIGDHSKTVLCAIHPTTDHRRRSQQNINRVKIIATLQNNTIHNNRLSISDYFGHLAEYKFIISPEGNGIDCHRHYEAIMAGCIPIIEDNPNIREKYKGCPVLYTTDYSEITEEYLQNVYNTMLHSTYDFSGLFIDSYSPELKKEIIQNGNHWGGRIYNNRWYDTLGITPGP